MRGKQSTSLLKKRKPNELLRPIIYNDCRVVSVRGIDDDNRKAYITKFFQQKQERSVRMRHPHTRKNLDAVQSGILSVRHSILDV